MRKFVSLLVLCLLCGCASSSNQSDDNKSVTSEVNQSVTSDKVTSFQEVLASKEYAWVEDLWDNGELSSTSSWLFALADIDEDGTKEMIVENPDADQGDGRMKIFEQHKGTISFMKDDDEVTIQGDRITVYQKSHIIYVETMYDDSIDGAYYKLVNHVFEPIVAFSEAYQRDSSTKFAEEGEDGKLHYYRSLTLEHASCDYETFKKARDAALAEDSDALELTFYENTKENRNQYAS